MMRAGKVVTRPMQSVPAARNRNDTQVSARFPTDDAFILLRSHRLICCRTTAKSIIWPRAWIENKNAVWVLSISQELEKRLNTYVIFLPPGSICLA
jgi:hypothetical protein